MLGGIFVGGASSRMGRPKGLLRAPGGELLIGRLARVMRDAGLAPILVGKRAEYARIELDVIEDSTEARGPLAGLLALLQVARGAPAIAVGCDMPFVTAELLRKLATASPAPIVAARGDRWEPLFARYDSGILEVARKHAREERYSLQALFESVEARPLELDEAERAQLADWDTPEDVQSAEGGARTPALARATVVREVTRVTESGVTVERDRLAVEEPLEIRAGREPIAVTMRTPGADVDLAVGFLLGEAIVRTRDDVRSVSPDGPNAVVVELSADAHARLSRSDRRFWVTSSCGVCGKESIDRIRAHVDAPVPRRATLSRDVIGRVPEALRGAQSLFDRTGALHAAGLFTTDGTLLRAAEDVGRHNAVDKVLGAELLSGQLARSAVILALSGRVAFELVQKAALARVGAIVAVGAPTSLAVELAEELGITLVGFAREGRFNVYARGASVEP